MASAQSHSVVASVPSSLVSPLSHINIPLASLFPSKDSSPATWLYTTVALVLGILALEQGVYRYKKSHLPGARWTIPLIGKFADSMKPTMEGYMKQWNSGALSAISVFNMYVRVFCRPSNAGLTLSQLHRHGVYDGVRTQDSQLSDVC